MTVERLVVGNLGTNCYIIGDEKKAVVVDPGGDIDTIKQHLRSRELVYILLTHTHIDHIGALNELKAAYPDTKVAVHEAEVNGLKDTSHNLSGFMGNPYTYEKDAELVVKEGDTLPFLDSEFKVIHTPGHTPGGVCFLIDNYLFSGDTLFHMSIGRTDFPGGSYGQLIDMIMQKLMTLPEDTKIFPGHMDESTIGKEKAKNPFLN